MTEALPVGFWREADAAQAQGGLGRWFRGGLAAEDIVHLILDGTVVNVRLDRRAPLMSLLIVLGVRSDGQNALLAVSVVERRGIAG